MTLLQLHSARSRSHAAYHAKDRRRPSRTNSRAVLKEVRRRVQEGLELEYQKAMRAERHAGSRGARALFLKQWVETGVARLHRQAPHLRPRLSLFTKQQNEAESEAPAKGTLHVRTKGLP